ncbi:hypothetical protein [Metabacillus sp. 84]|uniref:hypothetical protein n=1 Tax=Metabacillus sp. 84 TaxID=3404705 RepID=UPI003CF629A6
MGPAFSAVLHQPKKAAGHKERTQVSNTIGILSIAIGILSNTIGILSNISH